MSDLPTGTVTFMFTDIEGSTRLLQELGAADYGTLQDQHAAIVRTAIGTGRGREIRTEGDSFFTVFPTASGALQAAVTAQRDLASFPWPDGRRVKMRVGIHTGEGITGGGDYLGIDVNRAARIAATGHGGQIVLSETTRALVSHSLPDGVALRDLGLHRLKDLEHAEHLHDLVIEGLGAGFPALRSLTRRRTNLPPPRTSFVGRTREIAEIVELLRTSRLLTLTGPGGTGKTRLASKVAADLLDRFADGVFLVELGTVNDPGLVLPGIAGALGVRGQSGGDTADALLEYLKERKLLLVLDNFEQLVQASPLVDALLDGAPGITILVTSRIALRLSAEQEYEVTPLSLPDDDRVQSVVRLASSESVQLFVERAAAVRPGFHVTDEAAPAIAEIVARLDGLPLALELAASRLRVLSLDALAERLEHRLPLLTGGARDAPERQRTLAGAIAWSHDALEPDEQRLFARLAVFAGGWTLEAAESVCGNDLDVLESLTSLVEVSLVRRRQLPDGTLRFVMLETIREYATERSETLSSSDRETLGRGHAEFVRDLAERAEPHLTGEDQMAWLSILEREHENVRIALERAEAADEVADVTTGLRTAAAIWRFWLQRGHLAEGRARLEHLVDLPAAARRDAVRARAVEALGSLAYWLTDYGPASAMYQEAVDIARELGDRRLASWALFDLSFIPMLTKGDVDASEAILRESLATSEEGDLHLRARIWNALGFQETFRGNTADAVASFERAITMHRERGDRVALCESLMGLAAVEMDANRLDAVRMHIDEVTDIVRETASPLISGMAAVAQALLATRDGHHDRAARFLGVYEWMGVEYGVRFPDIALNHWEDPEEAARAALGDEEFERARAEGFSMNLDQILELVSQEAPTTSGG